MTDILTGDYELLEDGRYIYILTCDYDVELECKIKKKLEPRNRTYLAILVQRQYCDMRHLTLSTF